MEQIKKGRMLKAAILSFVFACATALCVAMPGQAWAATNVGTEADLKTAVSAGGEITLTADIVLTEPIKIEKDVVLNLNDNDITPVDTWANTSHDALFVVKRGATLTVNGPGSIDASSSKTYDSNGDTYYYIYAPIKLTEKGEAATGEKASLIVNGGTLKGTYYGIVGNGGRHDTSVTVNGGTVTANNGLPGGVTVGIFNPQNGTVTINGGKISGSTGIEMRAGALTVNGGTIEATAAFEGATANSSGTTTVGVAVAASQHNTNLPLSVNIKGGTLVADMALYEIDVQSAPAQDVSLSVTAGTLKGNVDSENCEKFISGGTFTGALDEEDLAEDTALLVNEGGDSATAMPAASARNEAAVAVTVDGVTVYFVSKADAEEAVDNLPSDLNVTIENLKSEGGQGTATPSTPSDDTDDSKESEKSSTPKTSDAAPFAAVAGIAALAMAGAAVARRQMM